MVRTTPRLFYQFFVKPNFDDFVEFPDDIRRAFNASVAAFQQADVFYHYCKRYDQSKIRNWPKLKNLHVHLTELDPHYLTIQSVATVYKHLYPSHSHYEVGSPADLWGVVSQGNEIRLEWGNAAADTRQVVVRLKNRSEMKLRTALESVVEHLWPSFLPEEDPV